MRCCMQNSGFSTSGQADWRLYLHFIGRRKLVGSGRPVCCVLFSRVCFKANSPNTLTTRSLSEQLLNDIGDEWITWISLKTMIRNENGCESKSEHISEALRKAWHIWVMINILYSFPEDVFQGYYIVEFKTLENSTFVPIIQYAESWISGQKA